jgi:flagellar basal body rod protein FlgF
VVFSEYIRTAPDQPSLSMSRAQVRNTSMEQGALTQTGGRLDLAIEGEGFVPGEDVAVAVITGHTDAAHTGTTRALIDPAGVGVDHAGGVIEVILFGRVSGTTNIRRLP